MANSEPHFAICLNCEWFDIAKDKNTAETKAETHNIQHHYGHFRWETIPFSAFNFPYGYTYDFVVQLLKKLTRKQRHEWFMEKKKIIYRMLPNITV